MICTTQGSDGAKLQSLGSPGESRNGAKPCGFGSKSRDPNWDQLFLLFTFSGSTTWKFSALPGPGGLCWAQRRWETIPENRRLVEGRRIPEIFLGFF